MLLASATAWKNLYWSGPRGLLWTKDSFDGEDFQSTSSQKFASSGKNVLVCFSPPISFKLWPDCSAGSWPLQDDCFSRDESQYLSAPFSWIDQKTWTSFRKRIDWKLESERLVFYLSLEIRIFALYHVWDQDQLKHNLNLCPSFISSQHEEKKRFCWNWKSTNLAKEAALKRSSAETCQQGSRHL